METAAAPQTKAFTMTMPPTDVLYSGESSRLYIKKSFAKDYQLAARTERIAAKCGPVEKVVKLPRAALIYFQDPQSLKMLLIKVFSDPQDFAREQSILKVFNDSPDLRRYIPSFDA